MIELYENGFRLLRPRVNFKPPTGGVRGRIVTFSKHSRLRLREFLLTSEIPDSHPYGVCLTIPEQIDKSKVLDLFAKAVHRLRVYFVRQYPLCGFVWRVELQRNTMPHLHLIAYFPRNYDGLGVCSAFVHLWTKIVCSLFEVTSLFAFIRYGVRVDRLDGKIAAYRYICDHAGKRKQAQLGYKGRQWGIIGREHFAHKEREKIEIPPCLEARFHRLVRRILSFTVKRPCVVNTRPKRACVFGCKHIRRKGKNAVNYVSRLTVKKFLSYHLQKTAFCKSLSSVLGGIEELPF